MTFYATFRRVYPVLEGDGGEHVIGSDEPLVFKIDNDVTTFCGTGNLIIDDEYLDMRTNCTVDPDNQTITLPATLLNTLALGEHSFEAYFTEPDSGSAKASFRIIEENEEDTSVPEENRENTPVPEENEENTPAPNTGMFTNEGGSAKTMNGFVIIAVIVGVAAIAGFLMKKTKRE